MCGDRTFFCTTFPQFFSATSSGSFYIAQKNRGSANDQKNSPPKKVWRSHTDEKKSLIASLPHPSGEKAFFQTTLQARTRAHRRLWSYHHGIRRANVASVASQRCERSERMRFAYGGWSVVYIEAYKKVQNYHALGACEARKRSAFCERIERMVLRVSGFYCKKLKLK